MADTPIKDCVRKLVLEILAEEGLSAEAINAKIEKQLEESVPIEVVACLHKQFTGDDAPSPANARKKRPRCLVCKRAKRKQPDGSWACKTCGTDA